MYPPLLAGLDQQLVVAPQAGAQQRGGPQRGRQHGQVGVVERLLRQRVEVLEDLLAGLGRQLDELLGGARLGHAAAAPLERGVGRGHLLPRRVLLQDARRLSKRRLVLLLPPQDQLVGREGRVVREVQEAPNYARAQCLMEDCLVFLTTTSFCSDLREVKYFLIFCEVHGVVLNPT